MVYIVEDDINIRELEAYALKASGYETMTFEMGKELLVQMEKELPQLILLDIMLPEEDGMSILKKIKENELYREIPVIMVTAKDTELDIVKALDRGADDYLAKPFSIMVLVSRVNALLRRTKKPTSETYFEVGEIVLDDKKHIVSSFDGQVDLTFKEYELLKYLIVNAGIVLSREKIMNTIWGYDFDSENRTVDVHIQTLRKKLGKSGNQIKTIRNVGYKLTEIENEKDA